MIDNPDDLCFRVDKGDGRVSWLYAREDGTLRSYRQNPANPEPRIGPETIRKTVEQTSYEVTVEDRKEMPDGG